MRRVGAIKNVGGEAAVAVPSSPHSQMDARQPVELPSGAKYALPLSLYSEPPLCEITIEEFEELALARLEGTRRGAGIG